MGAYAAQRAAQAVLLLLLVSLVGYAIMNLAPGGPLAVYLHNPQVTPERIDLLRHQLGLDRPWYLRYAGWLWGLLGGHWGYSYYTGRPVLSMIGERLPATVVLMLSAFALAGMHEIGSGSALDLLRHLAMPAVVLGVGSVASWSRYLRSSLLEALGQDYVRTAQAKGLPRARVLNHHVLRNSLIPVITIMGLDLHVLFSGAVITESIFGWPGMGRLFLSALNNRDYPLQMAGLMISGALLIGGNLLADLAYAALDPRVRYR